MARLHIRWSRKFPLAVAVLAVLATACGADANTGSDAVPTATPPEPSSEATESADPVAEPVSLTWAQGSENLAYAPIYVARELGYFEDEGLEIDFQVIPGAPDILAAVLGGSVQIGGPGANAGIQAAAQGQPVVTIGTITTRALNNFVFNKDFAEARGITEESSREDRIEAMRGAKIGSSIPGSTTDAIIRFVLSQNGIDPNNDVELVPFQDQGALLSALRAGTIDLLSFGPPASTSAVTDGYGVLALSLSEEESLSDLLWTSIVVQRSWLEDNEDVAVRFLRALSRADQFIHSDPDAARDATKTFFADMDDELFNVSWESSFGSFPESPAVTEANVAALVDLLNDVNDPDIEASFEEVATNEYVEQAAESNE